MKQSVIWFFASLWVLPVCFSQNEVSDLQEDKIEISFSKEGGYYFDEVEVAISSPGATVYYTLNGKRPSRRSKRYVHPILLRKTTIIRAIAYRGKEKSLPVGQTYFIDEPETDLFTVSIGITPDVLFDPQRGLFMKGSAANDELWNKPGANFWSRKEVRAHIDIFESEGNLIYSSQSGLRLFGGMSRLFPQKSLAIVARKRYGQKRIEYPIFGKKNPKKFKFLVLRNSGSDFGKTHFRDAFMTSLVDGWDIEKQAYQPAHVYINGKYWGIYNIREKVNRHFIAAHTDADKDSLDLLEHRYTRRRGSKKHYYHLLKYIRHNDLSDPRHYAYIQTQMEVDNFMNYQIAEIYFDNQDAGGNIKYWRPQTEDGKWRWILYDTDWGYGLHDSDAYKNNSLKFHAAADGPRWPNPPWSTYLLRNLLKNDEFKHRFVNRFADYLNTDFSAPVANEKISEMVRYLEPDMPRHLKRWRISPRRWYQSIKVMHEFASQRVPYMRMFLMDYFQTGAKREVNLQATRGGYILLNDNLKIRTTNFKGVYFERFPITLRAIPDYGYRFSHWEGVDGKRRKDKEVTITLDEEIVRVKAVFKKYTHPLAGKVIINEICPYNKKSGDWVELYNTTDETVNMSGWIFTDQKNEYVFPDAVLPPKDYLVVCKKMEKFAKTYPYAYNYIGGMKWGMNKHRETLTLFAADGASIDSVAYEAPLTDSSFVLSLFLPDLDNGNPENWRVRPGMGTPNEANPYYIESRIKLRQELWMQMGFAAGVLLLGILLLVLRVRRVF